MLPVEPYWAPWLAAVLPLEAAVGGAAGAATGYIIGEHDQGRRVLTGY